MWILIQFLIRFEMGSDIFQKLKIRSDLVKYGFSGFQDQQRVLQLLNHVVDWKMSHKLWLISEEITLESITKKCKPIYWDYIPGILGISIPMNGSWIHIHWFENLLSSSERYQNGHHFMGFSGRKSFLKKFAWAIA